MPVIETDYLDEAEAYLVGMMEEARSQHFALGLATGHWCLGRLAWRRGREEEALRHWRAALLGTRRFPHLTQGWKTMEAVADFYARHGDWRRAEMQINRAALARLARRHGVARGPPGRRVSPRCP